MNCNGCLNKTDGKCCHGNIRSSIASQIMANIGVFKQQWHAHAASLGTKSHISNAATINRRQ